jgi:phosphatidylserine synthase
MRKLNAGPLFAVFVIFFGASLVEAIAHANWKMALVYFILAFMFLSADGRTHRIDRTDRVRY